MPSRYQEWVSYVFDHPVNDPEWHFDIDAPTFEAGESEIAQLIDATFRHSGRDLLCFSDAQVNQGIWFLVSSSLSDYSFTLKDENVPLAVRLSAISSLTVLYRDCFANRCTQSLSHLDEHSDSPLNAICYMLWDVIPISYLEGHPDEPLLSEACFSVLSNTLSIEHLACQEAAIHGYGEFHHQYPDLVEDAMNRFLQTNISDGRLRVYAENAKIGYIQ